MKDLKKIKEQIRKAKTVAVSGHINPDGDSLGSLLALGLALESLGKRVYMLCQSEIPGNYRLLPGASRIIRTTNKKVDLAIAVDCAIIDLLDKNVSVFKNARSVLEIDHHEFRRSFGQMQIVDPQAASVGELVYALLKKLSIPLTRDIAENLLATIIVETNLFRLASVRPGTFVICAALLNKGLIFSEVVDKVYGARTKESMMLSALCLLRAKFLKKGRIIWSVVRRSDIAQVGGKDYDTDAIASEMNAMQGVDIAVLFKEKSKKILKVSLRSKGDVNVGAVAQEYHGGGHCDIAGCYIKNDTKSMARILSSLETLLS